MAGRLHSLGWLSATLVAALLIAAFTPVCAMATCNDSGSSCGSDFEPACGGCPTTMVMKHTADDAVASTPPSVEVPVALAPAPVCPVPVVVHAIADAPDATASPPPLDPLGVRLTL